MSITPRGLASLYRDDRQVQTGEMPARFPGGAVRVDVAANRYGIERIHLAGADGRRCLDPAPESRECRRVRLSRRHPSLGCGPAVGATVVLLIDLTLIAPRLLETVTHLPQWADLFAPFTSPIHLPAWANTTPP
ncbi:hypothetical protein [Streptomyces globisporus]|uniref:hypothetical protein n=1 Tax=Streptomyces globisporus TaxID=1908 RepID=UPI00368CDA10